MHLSTFNLSEYARSDKNYDKASAEEKEAYKSGLFDAIAHLTMMQICKVTGECESIEGLIQLTLNRYTDHGNLELHDRHGNIFDTASAQREALNAWRVREEPLAQYTHCLLANPSKSDLKTWQAIAEACLISIFPNTQYAFVLHTDTDTLHYHVVFSRQVTTEQASKLSKKYFQACLDAKLF